MPSADYWKRRATRTATERDAALAAVAEAQELLNAVQVRIEDRAALVSITRDNRKIKFTFVRNGDLTVIEVKATAAQD